MTPAGSGERFAYGTTPRYQLDERPLLLQGGSLDGLRCSKLVEVGQRVFCGDGSWATEGVYLVTAQTLLDDEVVRNVAIPAFA